MKIYRTVYLPEILLCFLWRRSLRLIPPIVTSIFLLMAGVGCTALAGLTENEDAEFGNTELLTLIGAYLLRPGAWTRITPGAGSISISIPSASTTKNFSYSPTCSGRPGTDATYSFYVKPGASSNLLINFMGGGACWDGKNCLGADITATYATNAGLVSPIVLAEASRFIDRGVLNHYNSANPFADWTMVFIPYCSGDVFWGSNDYTYTDPRDGSSSVIHHKGFDNFLSVLAYLKTVYPSANVGRVFVTGQSAGGYGAIMNFPYIKETYYSNQVDVVADASAGVTPAGYHADIRVKWGVMNNLPDWITGVPTTTGAFDSTNLGDVILSVANHAGYSASNLAHYTSAYDGNQRFFFNVQKEILASRTYVADATMWGKLNGYNVSDADSCTWNSTMRTQAATSGGAANFNSFISPGDVHTISMSNNFFTQSNTDGTVLVDWYSLMLNDPANWRAGGDKICTNGACQAPETEASPSGMNKCDASANGA